MKIKTKMLKNIISFLCAATMTTSCGVISASANGSEDHKKVRVKIEKNIARLEELIAKIEKNIAKLDEISRLSTEADSKESTDDIKSTKQNKIQSKFIKWGKSRNINKNDSTRNLVDIKNSGNNQPNQNKIEEKVIKHQNLPSIWKKNRPKIQNKQPRKIIEKKIFVPNKISNNKKTANINYQQIANNQNKQPRKIIEKKIFVPNKISNNKRIANINYQQIANNQNIQPYSQYFIDFETQNHIKIQPRIDQEIILFNRTEGVDNRQVQQELQNRPIYKKKINIPFVRNVNVDNNYKLGILEMNINFGTGIHTEAIPSDNNPFYNQINTDVPFNGVENADIDNLIIREVPEEDIED
jgi:hypothetical protein